MRLKTFLTALPMIVSCGVAVASCETPGATFPPAESLRVQSKPVPPDDVLTSRIEGERHDNAVDAWGERGWSFVGEQCRFWKRQGMDLDCPPPPERPDPG